ncbi:MAG: DNA primase small subunit domain-containing protein, partial [Candidatus Jordarchaeales archaeon]
RLKSRAKHAYPVGGEYVIDVDNYIFRGMDTEHPRTWICSACLEVVRRYTIRLSELIEENYESIKIVFNGAKGFHIHMLDFNVRDWTRYNEHDPVKSHEVARFCYILHFARILDTRFDEPHFTLSVDPMRI